MLFVKSHSLLANTMLTGCLVHYLNLQVEKNINNMTIKMPHQLFVNGEFIDAEGGKTYKTINPTDGTVRRINILVLGLKLSIFLK